MNRRDFVRAAAALGAGLAWGAARARASNSGWSERRDLYPQGVASGDPHPESVLLWTRRPPHDGAGAKRLTAEVAEDPDFKRVVASSTIAIDAENDWTCRVLAAGLEPARVYWYRFTDEHGHGSRVGRTKTAPPAADAPTVRFTFVSCQNVCQGAQNAYRRMLYEDLRKHEGEQLDFVLHLGDFIYELVWYPEDRPRGMYDRRLRDLVRFRDGEKVEDFHIAASLDDYRALYRAYLQDPDLQDARARWPFVCVWDNHEFSWRGWQSFLNAGTPRPAQTLKVAANQAWFEFQPARVAKQGGAAIERFEAPDVRDAPITRHDQQGLGLEPNNLAAVNSLIVYRRLRFGRNVDLVLTDQHSFQSQNVMDTPEAAAFESKEFPYLTPEEIVEIFDAGREYGGGKPPAAIRYGERQLPNVRKDSPPQTMLGADQKRWFLEQLRASGATWKIWGNSLGVLEWRADPQNLPDGLPKWPGAGYATLGGGDWSGYLTERAEIYDFVRRNRIAGFAIVSGDRHSFWAGLAAKTLPPRAFEPIGVAFITGSISAPALPEAAEHNLSREHPLRSLYLHQAKPDAPVERTMNMLLLHGVRSCLTYARTGDYAQAVAASNRELAPHLKFLDLGGHGYAHVSASSSALDVEFVCIPRPLERGGEDGGPLVYRVRHHAPLWKAGETPKVERTLVEGSPPLSF